MHGAKAHRHANGTGGLGGDRSRMFSQVELGVWLVRWSLKAPLLSQEAKCLQGVQPNELTGEASREPLGSGPDSARASPAAGVYSVAGPGRGL
jgi:hypothetical protein